MENYLEMFRNQYPFDLLSEDDFDHMFKDAKIKEFQENEFIIHEDGDSHSIHFLISGLSKNIMHRSNGKQISVRFYYPGDLIGVMIMLTSGEMNFSVQSLESSKTLCFNKGNFLEVMSNNNRFSKVVIEEISNLMKSLYQEIKYDSSKSDEDDQQFDIYQKRNEKFMENPVMVKSDNTIIEVAQFMNSKSIDSIVVSDSDSFQGVLNYQDVLKAFINNQQDESVIKHMNPSPYTVQDQDFIYDALSHFKYHPVGIIPVLHNQKIVGILRYSSFMMLSNSIYFDLRHQVSNALSTKDLKELAPIYNKPFQQFISDLIASDQLFAYNITELISSYNDKIHKRILQIAETEMISEGYGGPPINYCFLVLGSEGRKEQAFSTDQDNALIVSDYDHIDNKAEIEHYFKVFSEKVNIMLETCGYPLCTGGIMAREMKWRKSLSLWKHSVDEWITKMDGEEIRDFTIFSDFRPIYGDFSLAYELRNHLTTRIKRSLNLHQLLMKDTLRFKVPINPFGILQIAKKRKINLKKSAIMQIVNAIRIYSIKNGIDEVNTVNRLEKLTKNEQFHPRDSENAKLAIHRLLKLRLTQNLNELSDDKPLTNELIISDLSKEDKRLLKEALSIAKRLQQVLELSYNRNRVV